MTRGIPCALISALLFLSVHPSALSAADGDIVITEIAAYELSDHEWIEIFNKGATPVDLTGWKFFESGTNHSLAAHRGDLIIEPGEYAIIADVAANTATDYPLFTGTLIDSSWSTLTESGEEVILKTGVGVIVEQFTYSTAPDFSLERKDVSVASSDLLNWQQHVSGNTIGAVNSASASAAPQASPSTPPVQPSEPPPVVKVESSYGDVVINEFVADPADDEKEWIELYNTATHTIDLSEWYITDGSKARTALSGTIGMNNSYRYIVVENPAGKLGNAGDVISLFNASGRLINEVVYGTWDDGDKSDNAPAARDPYSVARRIDGLAGRKLSEDFIVTHTPTRGSANVVTVDSDPKDVIKSVKRDVRVTEALLHPVDGGVGEFIEVFNAGQESVDLVGWELVNESGHRYTIEKKDGGAPLKVGEYRSFPRSVSRLALRNAGDTIRLYQPDSDRPLSTLAIRERAKMGVSFSVLPNGKRGWTYSPTPGKANEVENINEAPELIAEIPSRGMVGERMTFDASDSADPNRDAISIEWNFGDGVSLSKEKGDHTYTMAGRYAVRISVTDGVHTITRTQPLVIEEADTVREAIEDSAQGGPEQDDEVPTVALSEIFPNPDGADHREYIELINEERIPVDISGWTITTSGKKKYKITKGARVEAGATYLISKAMSSISLKNETDVVSLYSASGVLVDAIEYEDVQEEQSYARTSNGTWAWTALPTPGGVNIFSNEGREEDEPLLRAARGASSARALKAPVQIELSRIRELEKGQAVRVQGIVSVSPGVFGEALFYLAGSGIQVYSAAKQFPSLAIGDRVSVGGILSESAGETRIRIKGKGDVQVVGKENAPKAHDVDGGEIAEEREGNLVRLTGTVAGVRWPTIHLDDGTDEVRVYVKKTTGIKKMNIREGDRLTVQGIVSQTSAGYRILPRSAEDILLVSADSNGEAGVITIPGRREEVRGVVRYLAASTVALGILAVGLFLRYRGRKEE